MNFLIDNFWILFALTIVGGVIAIAVYTFFKLPTKTQSKKIKEWLLYAVAIAEKELGSGTGQIKLRYVYDLFLAKFPILSKIVQFEQFSLLVDEALDKFDKMLQSNYKLSKYINKGE